MDSLQKRLRQLLQRRKVRRVVLVAAALFAAGAAYGYLQGAAWIASAVVIGAVLLRRVFATQHSRRRADRRRRAADQDNIDGEAARAEAGKGTVPEVFAGKEALKSSDWYGASQELSEAPAELRFRVKKHQRYLLSFRFSLLDAEDEAQAFPRGCVRLDLTLVSRDGKKLRVRETRRLPRISGALESEALILGEKSSTDVTARIALAESGFGRRIALEAVRLEELGPLVTPRRFPSLHSEPRDLLRVALIADEFTAAAFRAEYVTHELLATGIAQQLSSFRPDVIFVESAWRGADSQWRGKIHRTAEQGPSRELVALARIARALSVPTIFWNKEDPIHTDGFLASARLFDKVLTTDVGCVQRYAAEFGDHRCGFMPFTVQADIHNPIGSSAGPGRRLEVCFPGTWWAERYPERRAAQEDLLGVLAQSGLVVYDRHFSESRADREFPARHLRSVHGSLPYSAALDAYKSFNFVLNVNSVLTSPTMLSRRAIEAAASGAIVVSSPSEAVDNSLSGFAVTASTGQDAAGAVERLSRQPLDRAIRQHQAVRHTHRNFGMSQVVGSVLSDAVGRPGQRDALDASVSAVCVSMQPDGGQRVIDWFAQSLAVYPNQELVFVCGYDSGLLNFRKIPASAVTLLPVDSRLTDGSWLNLGLSASSGRFIARIDEESLYGKNYIPDMLLAAYISRADICGKRATFVYVKDTNRMHWQNAEWSYQPSHLVASATLFVSRSLLEETPFHGFPKGAGTDFVQDAVAAGALVFSADPFNFSIVRRVGTASRTDSVAPEAISGLSEADGGTWLERILSV